MRLIQQIISNKPADFGIAFANALQRGFVNAFSNAVIDKAPIAPAADKSIIFETAQVLRNLELFAVYSLYNLRYIALAVQQQKLQNPHLIVIGKEFDAVGGHGGVISR